MKPFEYLSMLTGVFSNTQSRRSAVLYLALIFLLILIIPLFIFERSSKSSLDSHKQKYNEFIVLSNDYRSLKEKVDASQNKVAVPGNAGVANTVNDIAASLGIKGKIKSIKGVSNRQLKGNISEETAEVYIEKVTMNELVNIFHKIETAPVVLSIKKTNIKKSFEKPDLLDVNINLAMFSIGNVKSFMKE